MSKERDVVPTNLRLPNHLHIKLSHLASIDDRSLHSLMLKILHDHVLSIEKAIFDKYDFEEFDTMYGKVFGTYVVPYIDTEEEMGISVSPRDVMNQIKHSLQRTPSANIRVYRDGVEVIDDKSKPSLNLDVDKLLE